MFIYMYLGCIKCNIDTDCGNITILKYFKTFKMLKLFNIYMVILNAAV
jgi:hypothetical protein